MFRTRTISITLLTIVALFSLPALGQATQPSQAELDKQFALDMTNVIMSGGYTATGSDKIGKDQYTIVSVTKDDGDNWTFVARIQFAGHDVNLPIKVPVKWAGDTPVISVTDLGMPGLGTYTARVVIYKGQYAGTWSGKGHGGQMWGHIERAPATQPAANPAK